MAGNRRGGRGGRRRKGAGGKAAMSLSELAAGQLPAGHGAREQLANESRQFLMSISGWDGANRHGSRGWIYWPSLDSQRDLDSYSRQELTKKARWLCANMGLPNRIVKGLADLIGYLTPVWSSGDEEWDREVENHYADRTESPLAVDRSGVHSIKGLQVELDRAAFRDGDVLPVAMEAKSSGGLLMMLYEGTQLQTPKRQTEKQGWHDGVQVDRFRRHRRYGLANGKGGTSYVDSADGFYYSHPDATARIRPPTILAHAVNHLQDVSEIVADWKLAIKVAAQLGLYLKTAQPGGPWGAQGFFSGLRNERHAPMMTDETEAGGGEPPASDGSDDRDVLVEDLFKGGGILNPPTGTEIATVRDERPHPNAMGLIQHMMRDISWGVGASPELLWDISGLRGANNRWANADLGRWLSCRLLRKRNFMRRYCAVWAAKEMKAGRLSEPSTGNFWRMSFIPQASLTADKGREGKLNIDLVQSRLRSLRTHFAEEGLHWIHELEQIDRERKMFPWLRGGDRSPVNDEGAGHGSPETHEGGQEDESNDQSEK